MQLSGRTLAWHVQGSGLIPALLKKKKKERKTKDVYSLWFPYN
jgi:hypothetical protein